MTTENKSVLAAVIMKPGKLYKMMIGITNVSTYVNDEHYKSYFRDGGRHFGASLRFPDTKKIDIKKEDLLMYIGEIDHKPTDNGKMHKFLCGINIVYIGEYFVKQFAQRIRK